MFRDAVNLYKIEANVDWLVTSLLLLMILVMQAASASGSLPTTQETDLYDLSLEELINVKINVPAAITKLTQAENPASVTIISAEDIRLSPSRNIYDLIETYVPGAIWYGHEQGPHPGVRGSIVSRNYKFLLLVNDRVMNSKAHYGAKSELEQWDLTDIEKIEIVRGPGSVTYGPGAVAGIIKITTKSAQTFHGQQVEARYVKQYDSRGANYSYAKSSDAYDLYSFVSATRTKGYKAKQFQALNTGEAGYVEEDILTSDEPLDYFTDYQDNPQYKLHVNLNFLQNWNFWFRYTQQGSTWRGNEVKSNFNGELLNQQSLRDRQATAVLEYKSRITSNLDLASMISVDSFDTERRGQDVRNPDPDNVQNFGSNYSENELFARAVLNWQPDSSMELALGAEFSLDKFGPGWGDSVKDMRLGDDGNIVNGPDSNAIGPSALDPADAIYAGSGWTTHTYSVFGEANKTLTSENILLVSARLDKNTYSDLLFSPRVAIIHKIENNHVVKVIAQQSQRMNTAGENFIQHKIGNNSQTESLSSLEFAYTGKLNEQTQLNLANFWNAADVIAWNNDLDRSIYVGKLKLTGIETELFYKWHSGRLGANYSYVKQLDWKLADGLEGSGISYSDYNQPLRNSSAVMLSEGNDLNNWPNQAFKLYLNLNITPQITWHIDTHVFWDFKGSKDGLESLHKAVQGQPEQALVDQSLDDIKHVSAYDYDFRLNTSLSYKPRDNLDIRFLIQNLVGSFNNKRYAYDTGMNRAAPHRVRFVEEPRTFGVTMTYQF